MAKKLHLYLQMKSWASSTMPTTWTKNMIEQGFNYADSTIKEKTDFFETRVENLESKQDRKKPSTASKKPRKPSKKAKGKTPTPLS